MSVEAVQSILHWCLPKLRAAGCYQEEEQQLHSTPKQEEEEEETTLLVLFPTASITPPSSGDNVSPQRAALSPSLPNRSLPSSRDMTSFASFLETFSGGLFFALRHLLPDHPQSSSLHDDAAPPSFFVLLNGCILPSSLTWDGVVPASSSQLHRSEEGTLLSAGFPSVSYSFPLGVLGANVAAAAKSAQEDHPPPRWVYEGDVPSERANSPDDVKHFTSRLMAALQLRIATSNVRQQQQRQQQAEEEELEGVLEVPVTTSGTVPSCFAALVTFSIATRHLPSDQASVENGFSHHPAEYSFVDLHFLLSSESQCGATTERGDKPPHAVSLRMPAPLASLSSAVSWYLQQGPHESLPPVGGDCIAFWTPLLRAICQQRSAAVCAVDLLPLPPPLPPLIVGEPPQSGEEDDKKKGTVPPPCEQQGDAALPTSVFPSTAGSHGLLQQLEQLTTLFCREEEVRRLEEPLAAILELRSHVSSTTAAAAAPHHHHHVEAGAEVVEGPTAVSTTTRRRMSPFVRLHHLILQWEKPFAVWASRWDLGPHHSPQATDDDRNVLQRNVAEGAPQALLLQSPPPRNPTTATSERYPPLSSATPAPTSGSLSRELTVAARELLPLQDEHEEEVEGGGHAGSRDLTSMPNHSTFIGGGGVDEMPSSSATVPPPQQQTARGIAIYDRLSQPKHHVEPRRSTTTSPAAARPRKGQQQQQAHSSNHPTFHSPPSQPQYAAVLAALQAELQHERDKCFALQQQLDQRPQHNLSTSNDQGSHQSHSTPPVTSAVYQRTILQLEAELEALRSAAADAEQRFETSVAQLTVDAETNLVKKDRELHRLRDAVAKLTNEKEELLQRSEKDHEDLAAYRTAAKKSHRRRSSAACVDGGTADDDEGLIDRSPSPSHLVPQPAAPVRSSPHQTTTASVPTAAPPSQNAVDLLEERLQTLLAELAASKRATDALQQELSQVRELREADLAAHMAETQRMKQHTEQIEDHYQRTSTEQEALIAFMEQRHEKQLRREAQVQETVTQQHAESNDKRLQALRTTLETEIATLSGKVVRLEEDKRNLVLALRGSRAAAQEQEPPLHPSQVDHKTTLLQNQQLSATIERLEAEGRALQEDKRQLQQTLKSVNQQVCTLQHTNAILQSELAELRPTTHALLQPSSPAHTASHLSPSVSTTRENFHRGSSPQASSSTSVARGSTFPATNVSTSVRTAHTAASLNRHHSPVVAERKGLSYYLMQSNGHAAGASPRSRTTPDFALK